MGKTAFFAKMEKNEKGIEKMNATKLWLPVIGIHDKRSFRQNTHKLTPLFIYEFLVESKQVALNGQKKTGEDSHKDRAK